MTEKVLAGRPSLTSQNGENSQPNRWLPMQRSRYWLFLCLQTGGPQGKGIQDLEKV